MFHDQNNNPHRRAVGSLWGIQALNPGLQQGSPSQGISLHLGQTLVCQSCNLCAIFTPGHLAVKTKCGWIAALVPLLEVLHGYRRMMVQDQVLSLLSLLPGVTLIGHLLAVSNALGFQFIPGMPHDVCFITDNSSTLLSLESEGIVPRVKAFVQLPSLS